MAQNKPNFINLAYFEHIADYMLKLMIIIKDFMIHKSLYNRVNIIYLNQSSENELINYYDQCKQNNLKFKII